MASIWRLSRPKTRLTNAWRWVAVVVALALAAVVTSSLSRFTDPIPHVTRGLSCSGRRPAQALAKVGVWPAVAASSRSPGWPAGDLGPRWTGEQPLQRSAHAAGLSTAPAASAGSF